MFEDIKAGIIEGDFSPTAIKEFFEATSSILFRDCKDCNNNFEIQKVANAARKGAKAVRNFGVLNYDDAKVRETSLNETEKILMSLHEISNLTLAYVEKYSYNSFFSRKNFQVLILIYLVHNLPCHPSYKFIITIHFLS